MFAVWWAWVVAGLVIGMVELVVPGYVFLGFSVGSVATGLLIWLGFDAGLPVLLLVFALISLVAWIALRRLFGTGAGAVKIWTRDINDN